MKRSTTTWTLAITAAALITLPAAGAAQTPATSQPPATQPPATSQQQPAATTGSTAAAQEHLAKATASLDEIKTATLSARAKSQVAEIKRRINALERTVAANDNASATGAANRSARATTGARGNANWGTEVAAIDKALTALIGPDTAAATGAAGTTGTSGTAAPGTAASKTAGAATLDDATRASLTEVRTHLTAFAAAMAGGPPKTPSTEPTGDPGAATQTSGTSATSSAPTSGTPTGSTAAPSTPPTSTPPASTTPQTSGAATPQTPQATMPAATQPDEQAARRHLTEARNTLSAMTQLPAASQLSGEARTQVSQLISNFNELITTQSEWRAAYAKVSANLVALIGPDATGTTTDPAATAGTAGAVGTSGTVAGGIDPTLRDKLIELRRNLSEFEKAAGGGAPASGSTAATSSTGTSSTTPPATTDPSTPATTTPATPTTTPPTASSTTPSSQTPGAQGTTGAQSTAGNAEVMRHIAAIEALLKLEDEGGGLTLTKAQVEQLRTHWAALKASIDKK
jgi:hypothetical protein